MKVHYEGTLVNGKVFDSSLKRGEPATFPLNGVIPCWTEAVQLMKVGGKARITCPAELAYGEQRFAADHPSQQHARVRSAVAGYREARRGAGWRRGSAREPAPVTPKQNRGPTA